MTQSRLDKNWAVLKPTKLPNFIKWRFCVYTPLSNFGLLAFIFYRAVQNLFLFVGLFTKQKRLSLFTLPVARFWSFRLNNWNKRLVWIGLNRLDLIVVKTLHWKQNSNSKLSGALTIDMSPVKKRESIILQLSFYNYAIRKREPKKSFSRGIMQVRYGRSYSKQHF